MPFLTEFLTVFVLQLLVIISPGTDFAIICHNSLVYSRITGIYSSLGLALGILVHVTYSLVGIGLIISKSILLFSLIKLLGAAYLIYIGYKSLQAKPDTELKQQFRSKQDISKIAAVRIGFISNVLNPKVTLFFLSLFTQVINSHTPVVMQIWYGLQMFIMAFAWYTIVAIVAIVMSHSMIKDKLLSVTRYVEKAIGAILVALGIKVALSAGAEQ